jgi:lipopolysaccharide transport system ATP-binding protein
MGDVAIRIEGLGKQYRLGGPQERYSTIRDQIRKWTSLRTLLRRATRGDARPLFWALKDVSFSVKRGEVVGIIGRNGAGKSTLLKILSRITEPTEGEVDIHGRVGSLLEVGTGFHPELTGRENVFLNGAIMGMRREEIVRKFDDIVAFAEVEKFIDTPVKRYSSGMYTRLAFAVAAHLEPEILIVDEVLAVGDVEFQKKCLGKMGDVAKGGRTVLFVSHNMAAVQNLCTTGVLLSGGRVVAQGNIADVINRYLSSLESAAGYDIDLRNFGNRGTRTEPLISRVRLYDGAGRGTDAFPSGSGMVIELFLEPKTPITVPYIGIGVNDKFGQRLFTVGNYYSSDEIGPITRDCVVRCEIDELPLAPGHYTLTLAAGSSSEVARDWLHHAVHFTVVEADFFECGKQLYAGHGAFLVRSRWAVQDALAGVEADGEPSKGF